MHIAIMQGRLVPPTDGRIQCFPRERWRDEFALAAAAGLDAIEWIYDLHGADVNPIATDDGVGADAGPVGAERSRGSLALRRLLHGQAPPASRRRRRSRSGRRPCAGCSRRCAMLGVGRVVLPFVDASRIDSDAELDHVVGILGRAAARRSKRPASSCTWRPRSRRIDSPSCSRGCRTRCSRSTTTRATARRWDTTRGRVRGLRRPASGSVHIKDRVSEAARCRWEAGTRTSRPCSNASASVGYQATSCSRWREVPQATRWAGREATAITSWPSTPAGRRRGPSASRTRSSSSPARRGASAWPRRVRSSRKAAGP